MDLDLDLYGVTAGLDWARLGLASRVWLSPSRCSGAIRRCTPVRPRADGTAAVPWPPPRPALHLPRLSAMHRQTGRGAEAARHNTSHTHFVAARPSQGMRLQCSCGSPTAPDPRRTLIQVGVNYNRLTTVDQVHRGGDHLGVAFSVLVIEAAMQNGCRHPSSDSQ